MARFQQDASALLRALRTQSKSTRVAVVLGSALLGLLIVMIAPPEPQDQSFHSFAPSALFGVEHFGIVATNGAFLLIGLLGLWQLYGRGLAKRLFTRPGEHRPFGAFFLFTAILAFASGYYHAAPQDSTLVWDRLGMTLVFMAFFAAVITDRIDRDLGAGILLPLLLALGALSIGFWVVTDDLRLYRLVQGLPVVLILVICTLFEGRITRLKYILWMIAWFALATLFEQGDSIIYEWIAVGGHVLKHVIAALACAAFLVMLRRAGQETD